MTFEEFAEQRHQCCTGDDDVRDLYEALEQIERLRAVHEQTCRDTSRVIEDQRARIGAAVAAINAGRDKSIAAILRGEKL